MQSPQIKGYMFVKNMVMASNGYAERYAMQLTKASTESKESRGIFTIRTRIENMSNISVAWREQSWLQYKLNDEELRNGCRLVGFDSYANTCCAG